MLVPVQGLFEAHLNVSELRRSLAFYNGLLGLAMAATFPERRVSFVWVGAPGQSMLGLWEVGSSPQRSLFHVALKIAPKNLFVSLSKLRCAGIQTLDFRGYPADEPIVLSWMPAASIYFRDPDDNLLELVAMLPDPPKPSLGIVPWSEWVYRSPDKELVNSAIFPSDPRGESMLEDCGLGEKVMYPDSPMSQFPQDLVSYLPLMKVFEAPAIFDRDLVFELMRLADDSETEIRSYLQTGRLFLLGLGDLNHAPDGQILVQEREKGFAEIKSLSISPQIQHVGLGTFFLREVLASLKKERTTHVEVSTSTADLDSIKFYQRNGFRLVRVERDAFTSSNGYPESLSGNGIPIRDRIWLDIQL